MLEFGFIAADTSRSRIYLNALHLGNLRPSLVVLIPPSVEAAVGMVGRDDECLLDDPEWPEAKVDLRVGLTDLLDSFGYRYVSLLNSDINDPAVVNYFSNSEVELFVYSGYGGSILRAPILSLGKFFLHVHGGFLPYFRGSTTNYYSILKERQIGASSIFLERNIDQGPIIDRQYFRLPSRIEKMDHFYDSAARSRVLVGSLKQVIDGWPDGIVCEEQDSKKGKTYYIIHPVLKHVAIMKGSDG